MLDLAEITRQFEQALKRKFRRDPWFQRVWNEKERLQRRLREVEWDNMLLRDPRGHELLAGDALVMRVARREHGEVAAVLEHAHPRLRLALHDQEAGIVALLGEEWGRPLTYDELSKRIPPEPLVPVPSPNVVKRMVSRLRRKLANQGHGDLVCTSRGPNGGTRLSRALTWHVESDVPAAPYA
jgi:hypothetical protein